MRLPNTSDEGIEVMNGTEFRSVWLCNIKCNLAICSLLYCNLLADTANYILFIVSFTVKKMQTECKRSAVVLFNDSYQTDEC